MLNISHFGSWCFTHQYKNTTQLCFYAGLAATQNTNQKKAYRNIAYDINTVQSAPGTITDQEIVFRVPFDTIPIVIVSIESSTINANYGKITAFVNNRSKTGFTLRLANASENNLTPAIAWVAIAK